MPFNFIINATTTETITAVAIMHQITLLLLFPFGRIQNAWSDPKQSWIIIHQALFQSIVIGTRLSVGTIFSWRTDVHGRLSL